MQIIQELLAGTLCCAVDGSEQWYNKPPTGLNQRAARHLLECVQVLQGLERANQTLSQQLESCCEELNALRSIVQVLRAKAAEAEAAAAVQLP